MAKITLTYPVTGLTIAIVVKNRATGTTVFSGTMTEIGTTAIYKYDFTEVAGNDYVYSATCAGYDTFSGTLYDDSAISSDSISMAQAVRTEIAVELARIDMNISAVGSGLRMGTINNEIKPKWIKELLDEQKEEILKELSEKSDEKEKIDLYPILDKIDKIKIPDNKIEKETLKKVDKIEKWIEEKIVQKEEEIIKEEIEKEKERKEKLKKEKEEKKEQKMIEDILKKVDEYKKEEDDILNLLKKIEDEEINNILKLIK